MKNIVVSTPTGNIGSRVVHVLIQAGVSPTLLVRDPSRLPDAVRAASVVKQGDLADASFVKEATQGADALFWLIPTNYASADPVGSILEMGRVAAAAMRENAIGRTVFLSSSGAEGRGNNLIGALGQVEEMLNATGRPVLHLRPGYLFTNLLTSLEEIQAGVLTTTTPLDHKAGWNDPRDVGEIAAARLLFESWSGQSVQAIGGPEDLSYAEVAAIVSGAVGSKIEAVRITDHEQRQALVGAGLPGPVVEALVELSRSIAGIKESHLGRGYVSTTPTTLGAWSYANLRPLLG
jgi:uncharacterized protein YbjT (DUF2867 family)